MTMPQIPSLQDLKKVFSVLHKQPGLFSFQTSALASLFMHIWQWPLQTDSELLRLHK